MKRCIWICWGRAVINLSQRSIPLVLLINTLIFLNYMYTYTHISFYSQYFLSIDYTVAYSVHVVVECISRTLSSFMAKLQPLNNNSHFFFPPPLTTTILFSVSVSLVIVISHVNRIVWYLSFCNWLTFLYPFILQWAFRLLTHLNLFWIMLQCIWICRSLFKVRF